MARAWPPDGPPRDVLAQVHGWLSDASALEFVPVPLRASDGLTLHERRGRLWEVGPWLEGQAEARRPPPIERVRAAHAGLAAFHLRLAHHATSGPSPGVRARLDEVERLQRGGFATIGRVLAGAVADRPSELARRWHAVATELAPGVLDRLRRAAGLTVPRQPCLRDARPEHFLFQGNRLTGLVDFGAMADDSVAADLARLNAEWLEREPALRDAALEAYVAIRPLDPSELALIPVLEDASSLLIGGHWVRWHFLERRPFDDPSAVSLGLEKGLERTLALACPEGRALPGSRGA